MWARVVLNPQRFVVSSTIAAAKHNPMNRSLTVLSQRRPKITDSYFQQKEHCHRWFQQCSAMVNYNKKYESSTSARRFSSTSGNDGKSSSSSTTITTAATTTATSTSPSLNSTKPASVSPSRPRSSDVFHRVVHVHPLSQIILEYFQEHCNDWIVAHGLDQSLTIHRDGTFELVFQEEHEGDGDNNERLMKGTENHNHEVRRPLSPRTTSIRGSTITNHGKNLSPPQHHQQQLHHGSLPLNRMWTSYDEQEKKHWLTIHRAPHLHRRFLLQDNLAFTGTWHGRDGDRSQTQQRIYKAIHDMIQSVEEDDREREHNNRLLLELQQQQQEQYPHVHHHHHHQQQKEKQLELNVQGREDIAAAVSHIQDNDGNKDHKNKET